MAGGLTSERRPDCFSPAGWLLSPLRNVYGLPVSGAPSRSHFAPVKYGVIPCPEKCAFVPLNGGPADARA